MFRCLNLLLLCLVYHSGNTSKSVRGKNGGYVTLTCEFKANIIVHIELFSQSEEIDVCQDEECSVRVFKEGNCDVVIKNLSFSDAGKYILHVYYNNDQTELERQIRTYQLHIYDEITVKTGEELKMSVLFPNADKVEKSSSREWKEVWKRGHGVWSDRLNVTDGNLIIKSFLDSDAGTYRVLDTERNILITVTVTESGTESNRESKGKRENDKDKTNGTEQHQNWIVLVGVCLGILAVIVISVIIWRRQHRGHVQENTEHRHEPEESSRIQLELPEIIIDKGDQVHVDLH